MEHTHLVKGLDYSLLHKVRSEIAMREQKNDEALESQYNVSHNLLSKDFPTSAFVSFFFLFFLLVRVCCN